MVETMIVTVLFLSAILFAVVQLNTLVVHELIANETAFSTARVAVVTPKSALDRNTKLAALELVAPYVSPDSFIPLKAVTSNEEDIPSAPGIGHPVELYQTELHYAIRIYFASLLQPFFKFSFLGGGNPYYTNVARARMVKSPDESYFKKAYPDAKNFDYDAKDYLVLAELALQ